MTITISATDPTAQEASALIAFAGAFTVAGGAPTVSGGTSTVAGGASTVSGGASTVSGGMSTVSGGTSTVSGGGSTPADNPTFPALPPSAPYPSPDGSIIQIYNGAVVYGMALSPAFQGTTPYLRDATGTIWTLAVVSGQGVPSRNGVAMNLVGSGPNMVELTIRSGNIWGQVGTGQWQEYNSGMGDFNNGTLPPVATATGGTSTGTSTPSAPALPTPSAIAPGSSGRTLTVGPSGTYKTITAAIQAAQAGDLITVAPGTYKEAPPAWTVPLRISSASPGATIDCTGLTASLARGKACLVPCADTILDWMIPINVATDQTTAQLTCGIRPDAGLGYLTLNNCGGNNNQCGLGGGAVACVVVDNNGSYLNCGITTDGMSHAIYWSTGTLQVKLNGTQASSPQGHGVKVRAPSFAWTGGTGSAPNATILDIPDGLSQAGVVANVTFTKTATDPNHGIIGLNMESLTNGTAGLTLSACTIAALCASPLMESNGGTIAVESNCTLTGNKITAQVTGAGAVTGLPA